MRAGPAPKVVLEATNGWSRAADALEAAGAEVHLAHPLWVKTFSYRRVKKTRKTLRSLRRSEHRLNKHSA